MTDRDTSTINQFYTCTERIARVLEDSFNDIETIEDMEPINTFVENYLKDSRLSVKIKLKDHGIDSMYDLSPKRHNPVNTDMIHISLPVGPVGADDYLQRAYKVHKRNMMCIRTTKAGKITPTNPLDQRRDRFVFQYGPGYFGNGKTYESPVLLEATKQDIMKYFNQSIHYIENYHHVFLEGLTYSKTRKDGVHILTFITGS